MISMLENIRRNENSVIVAVGLSTDTKPTEWVANGSMFIEMDTSKLYFFDAAAATWREFSLS